MEICILSNMAKVFQDEIPNRYSSLDELNSLYGEEIQFQVAIRNTQEKVSLRFLVDGLSSCRVFRVRQVPVACPARWEWDSNYLRTEPGLYPDLLEEFSNGAVVHVTEEWCSILVQGIAPRIGICPIHVGLYDRGNQNLLAKRHLTLRCSSVSLPYQTLRYTRWFHCDSLADYYRVSVFGEEHWHIMENFLHSAASQGMNMVLTPIHTPPLDTEIGEERTTVQLVKIFYKNKFWSFDFSLLDRWVEMCHRVGIHYFEMAHLFTQWGASAAPKIVVETEKGEKRFFGWDTPSDGEDYQNFLQHYLPALTSHLTSLGIAKFCYFHISDEPSEQHLSRYMALKNFVSPLLNGFHIMDALSDVELFRQGAVNYPIPSNDVADEFLQENVPERWTYYCCAQKVNVSNSFIAMPGERTRILGIQLYRMGIQGFLQWGLNYYYTEHTGRLVNPFLCTDGDGSWQAGDPFNLYPGSDGNPIESLRSRLMASALSDLSALEALENRIGRKAVCDMLDSEAGKPITFRDYPHKEEFILRIRRIVNDLMETWNDQP